MILNTYLEAQTKERLINIMHEALDLMQQCNGRSQLYCIVEAAGGMIFEQEDGSFKFSLPEE